MIRTPGRMAAKSEENALERHPRGTLSQGPSSGCFSAEKRERLDFGNRRDKIPSTRRGDCFLEPVDTSSEEPACVVILIHGTGARDEPWTREGPLCDKVREDIPGAHVYRFEWSGENSHHARLDAEAALRELITEHLEKDPVVGGLEIYLVAHSHGGNVVYYAMKDESVARAVNGVICLGTPFLVIIPTQGKRTGVVGLINWVGVPILLVTTLMIVAATVATNPVAGSAWLGGTGAVVAAIMWRLSRRGHRFPIVRMFRERKGPTKEQEARLVHPRLEPKKVRILSAIADEAGGGLNAALMFAWLGRKIIVQRDRLAKVGGGIVVTIFAGFAVVDGFMGDLLPEAVDDVSAFALGLITLVLAAVGVVVNSLLVYLPNGAFGWDAMSWSRRRQTAAEESPPGLSNVVQLVFDRQNDDSETKTSLRHSELCWRPEAVAEIVGFIRHRRGG